MFKEEVLENEKRRNIYAIIEANPGIHFRELQRILDIPLATLEYHLSYMTRRKIVFGEKTDHYMRYYVKPLDSEDKRILTALRQKKLREIVLIILANRKMKYQFLADYFRLPHSTLSFYLKYLVDHNIVVRNKVGYENLYTIQDEDRIAKILVAYKSSFLDRLVDKTLSTWMETRFRQEKEKPR
jgi:predicted transcriptional regulator